ncbi:MAG: 16S rRNA (cytidine(1402)-2'-O)-methyltransferase [Gemmatimonadota bacterium]|nr:MAG: 16S rRNA (cytidine(1402)-2'-O)-methyltransferase [Gemmatimonadota bacterium]
MSAGTLYVVATPLGHLGDLSERAASVLRSVNLVAAEDTRRARVLLERAKATPRVLSYHAHSPASRAESLIDSLRGGESVALLADAGTPTVSDPGVELVRRAHEAGVPVVTVPGPSAVTAALSISGLPADRYTFLGFLPRKGRDRRALVQHAATSPWTTVLFEAPGRLVRLLHDLAQACGPDRRAAVARELTKVHEELKSGTLSDLEVYYEESPPRGEVTVLIAGTSSAAPAPDEETVRDRARELLGEGMSRRDAADRLAAELAVSRREAYRIVTNL